MTATTATAAASSARLPGPAIAKFSALSFVAAPALPKTTFLPFALRLLLSATAAPSSTAAATVSLSLVTAFACVGRCFLGRTGGIIPLNRSGSRGLRTWLGTRFLDPGFFHGRSRRHKNRFLGWRGGFGRSRFLFLCARAGRTRTARFLGPGASRIIGGRRGIIVFVLRREGHGNGRGKIERAWRAGGSTGVQPVTPSLSTNKSICFWRNEIDPSFNTTKSDNSILRAKGSCLEIRCAASARVRPRCSSRVSC